MFKRFAIILLAAANMSTMAYASSPCQGLNKAQCTANNLCRWQQSYTYQRQSTGKANGPRQSTMKTITVRDHCRAKPQRKQQVGSQDT